MLKIRLMSCNANTSNFLTQGVFILNTCRLRRVNYNEGCISLGAFLWLCRA